MNIFICDVKVEGNSLVMCSWVYSLAYALQMSSSDVMKFFTVILPVYCLYHCLLKPPCSIHVREIVNSAIQIEEYCICQVLPFNLMGMNASLMSQYIQF
jgi:hypothetical protein